MLSAGKRRYARRWIAARQACAEFLFCLGFFLVPTLSAIDMSVWLDCRDLSPRGCVDSLVLSVAQMDFPAGAGP